MSIVEFGNIMVSVYLRIISVTRAKCGARAKPLMPGNQILTWGRWRRLLRGASRYVGEAGRPGSGPPEEHFIGATSRDDLMGLEAQMIPRDQRDGQLTLMLNQISRMYYWKCDNSHCRYRWDKIEQQSRPAHGVVLCPQCQQRALQQPRGRPEHV